MSALAIEQYANEIKGMQAMHPVVGPHSRVWFENGCCIHNKADELLIAKPTNEPDSILGFYQRKLAEADAVIAWARLSLREQVKIGPEYEQMIASWARDSLDRWSVYPQGK